MHALIFFYTYVCMYVSLIYIYISLDRYLLSPLRRINKTKYSYLFWAQKI